MFRFLGKITMGERVGGVDPCDPPGKRSFVRRAYDWLFGRKSHGNVTVGAIENIPTFSPAPDDRIPSTIGGAIQDYRDSGPTPIYGAMGVSILTKGITDGALDFGNFLRNSFFNKSDYSGLGPRMTKWDGNTMGGEESQNAKFNAVLFADGLMTAGVGSVAVSEAGSINYMKSTDNFAKFASKAESQAGALDVIGHGNPKVFEVNNITIDGGSKLINHRVLATLIKQNPQFVGQDIRLLSCNTGEANFAQNLANKLNTNVFAPNKTLWAWPNGRLGVYPANAQGLPILSQPGKMIKFTPKK